MSRCRRASLRRLGPRPFQIAAVLAQGDRADIVAALIDDELPDAIGARRIALPDGDGGAAWGQRLKVEQSLEGGFDPTGALVAEPVRRQHRADAVGGRRPDNNGLDRRRIGQTDFDAVA